MVLAILIKHHNPKSSDFYITTERYYTWVELKTTLKSYTEDVEVKSDISKSSIADLEFLVESLDSDKVQFTFEIFVSPDF